MFKLRAHSLKIMTWIPQIGGWEDLNTGRHWTLSMALAQNHPYLAMEIENKKWSPYYHLHNSDQFRTLNFRSFEMSCVLWAKDHSATDLK
jgi:hypothetical protein